MNEKRKKKNIWVTSDLHLGHGNIMKYCSRTKFMTDEDREKFLSVKDDNGQAFRSLKMSRKSIENMDDAILGNINRLAMPEDQLWILGDFAWGRDCSDFYDYRKRINCEDVRLIWGNHDDRYLLKQIYYLDPIQEPFQGYYESGIFIETDEGLLSEDEIVEMHGARNPYKRNQRWYFNHYMNAVWNGSHKNYYHCYGHSHMGAEKWREQHMPNALCFDVGVDGHDYIPWSLEEIKNSLILKKQKVGQHAIDHHEERIKIVRDRNGSH